MIIPGKLVHDFKTKHILFCCLHLDVIVGQLHVQPTYNTHDMQQLLASTKVHEFVCTTCTSINYLNMTQKCHFKVQVCSKHHLTSVAY